MQRCMLLTLSVLLICVVSLQAGVIIKSSEKSSEMNLDMQTTMYVEKDRLRMEIAGAGPAENQIIIFRGDKNVFWTVNPDKKTYLEMTEQDMVKLKAQMDNMQKMMQEQMKNMPEEQRKMMEQMMPSNIPSANKPKIMYSKKSTGVKVGKWTTTYYEGIKEGKKSNELWTADWNAVGLNRDDFKALHGMGEFFKALSQETSELMKVGSEEWEKEQGISGIPVKWVQYIEGRVISEGMIKEVVRQDINASMFELPSGFTQEESPWEKQGPGMNP